jgi:HEPN domain-containing protein
MKPVTHEWIEKAEGDFCTLEREARVRKNPNFDAVCFHAQQCCEKYLKARLVEADIEFRKTHDLTSLLDLVLPVEPTWETCREDLAYLTQFGVIFRYPGDAADREMAQAARKRCKSFRDISRAALV